MEFKETNNILEDIRNLEDGQRLYIPIDKDICRKMKLLHYKKVSYENLFTSCLVDNQIKNKFDLEKFLNKYVNVYMELDDLIKEAAVSVLGLNIFRTLLRSGLKYEVNWELGVLMIYRR